MELAEVRVTKLGLALDLAGLFGSMMGSLLAIWGTVGSLIYFGRTGEIMMGGIAALVCTIVGPVIWWISSGVLQRKRVRTALAGIASFAFGLIPVFEGRLAAVSPHAIGYAGIGLLLFLAAFMKSDILEAA